MVDLNPVWDQIIYTPVHSHKETLLLEVMDYQNLTKDRSLGTVELKVSELAREMKGGDDSRFAFESTGKMDKSEPISLDRGNQYKGELHYLAEFLPAFALEGLKFDTGSNELQAAVDGVEDGDDVEGRSSTSSEREVRVITTKITNRREGSPPTQVDGRDGANQKKEGIRMSKDELLTHRRW